jgi:hypothetical protein
VGLRRLEPDVFHAIASQPVWWTATGDNWTPASAVDRDSAGGLVSILVVTVAVKLTFSLRTRGNGLNMRLQPLPLALAGMDPASIDAFGAHKGVQSRIGLIVATINCKKSQMRENSDP